MIFGIWPGVVPADLVTFEPVACPPEDASETLTALRDLHGGAPRFYIRCFRHFGPGAPGYGNAVDSPRDPGRYLGEGRVIDMVCCYQVREPDAAGFARFVRQNVRDVHAWGGGKVQVGEELNMGSPLDGGSPGCFEAIGAAVIAAIDERDRLGADVLIGVNAAGLANADFWRDLATALGAATAQIDYLGIDMFPDVFYPIPEDQLASAVTYLIQQTRDRSTAAGFPASLPLHIGETGWPTGPDRDEPTQARRLTHIANSLLDANLGITAYEFFGLRDILTTGQWQHRFGILRDDYTPKVAYRALQNLITQRSSHPTTPSTSTHLLSQCADDY